MRSGGFWSGEDDRDTRKLRTWAHRICLATLILWTSWFVRTSRTGRAYAMFAQKNLGKQVTQTSARDPETQLVLFPR